MPQPIGTAAKFISNRVRQAATTVAERRTRERLQATWIGYAPDADADRLPFTAAKAGGLRNLLERRGKLSSDLGLGILTPDTTGSGLNYPVGDDNSGSIEAPVTSGTALACVGMGDLTIAEPRLSGAPDVSVFHVFGAAGGSTVGHMVAWNGSGEMVEVPYNSTLASNGDEIQNDASSLDTRRYFHWAAAAFAGSAGTGGGHTAGGVALVNGIGANGDVAYLWDPAASGSPTFPGELDYFPLGSGSISTSFKANSVTAWGDRYIFFGTEEDDTANLQRVRWTAIGSADLDDSVVGAGFMDLFDLDEEGLRIEPLGNRLACYSKDGVVFLERTTLPNAPFRKALRSKDRGLVGRHALCPIGQGAHFGIFDDGWFILDANGEWTEVGLIPLEGGGILEKWKSTFYDEILPSINSELIFCQYDRRQDQIRITFGEATSDHGQTWVYKLRTDSVWPMDDEDATVFGEAVLTRGGITWASGSLGSWSATGAAWGSYAADSEGRVLLRGDSEGNVYAFDPDIIPSANYNFISLLRGSGQPSRRRVSRMWLNRDRLQNQNPNVTLIALDESSPNTLLYSDQIATVASSQGAGQETLYVDLNVVGEKHSLAFLGSHPISVNYLDVFFEEGIMDVQGVL